MDCKHFNFKVTAKVARLTDGEDQQNVTGYTADICISCADCGLPFEFMGLPAGYHCSKPAVSADATELRAPIRPSTDPVEQCKILLKTGN